MGKLSFYLRKENPNSVGCNKTLLNSICDENDTSSMAVSLTPVECEQDLISSSPLKHKIRFVQSMFDEKKSRKYGGLQRSGSNMHSFADCVTAKGKLGTFKIHRKIGETKEITVEQILINFQRKNFMNLQREWKQLIFWILNIPKERLMQLMLISTWVGFFKKILFRKIAEILQWDATKDKSQILDDAKNKLNLHLKKENRCQSKPYSSW